MRLAGCGLLTVACVFAESLNSAAREDERESKTIRVLSGPETVDRVYKSMEGINRNKPFSWPGDAAQPELLWVTAGKMSMFKEEDGSDGTERFLCHGYLKFDPRYFKASHGQSPARLLNPQGRLFTFVQGQPEIRLPKGFGIPVLSTEPFAMEYMVMNPVQPPQPFHVDSVGAFDYVRDRDLREPLKPLFMRIVGMHVPVRTGSAKPSAHCSEAGDMAGGGDMPNMSAIASEPAAEADAVPAPSSIIKIYKNRDEGFEQVYHWMVPPGRHVYRYQLETGVFGSLPFDTTLHYINAHLHPHGEFIELWDATEGRMIFRSEATNNPDRNGLLKLTDFSSQDGVPVRRDHRYEMVAGYHNTTDRDIDAMAILFVYLLDTSFSREQIARSSAP